MKRGFILLLALCSLAACMVPRDRRAVNTEEEEEQLRAQTTTTKPDDKPKEICASDTPCLWAIYKPRSRYVEFNITNSYCECSPDTVCQNHEDDSTVNAYIYRCRKPAPPEDIVES